MRAVWYTQMPYRASCAVDISDLACVQCTTREFHLGVRYACKVQLHTSIANLRTYLASNLLRLCCAAHK